MKVWILQTGEPLHIDSAGLRSMRAMNLSNALIAKGHQVVLWSSDFDHFSKTHRTGKTSTIEYSENLEIRLVSSRGYKSHIGLSRLFDHAQLAFNLKKQLKNQTPPDIAFIGYPPIETAWVITNWLSSRKVPSIVDVKDAWPEIYLHSLSPRLKTIALAVLWPYTLMMKSIFRKSLGINSVTEDFLSWSLNKIPRYTSGFDHVTYLTSAEKNFSDGEIAKASSFWDSCGVLNDDIENIFFLGTINNVYDFDQVIYAAQNSNFRYIIAGDGPNRDLILSERDLPNNLFLPGWISEVQAYVLASRSKAAIAPIRDRNDFAMNITNKFFDAMRFGIPMVTSIKGIAAKTIDENKVGISYKATKENSLLLAIKDLLEVKGRQSEFSSNARKLYEMKYSHEKNYQKLVQHLEKISEDKKTI
jgi:glycosyltransferase involved in cell wall biosynthesis